MKRSKAGPHLVTGVRSPPAPRVASYGYSRSIDLELKVIVITGGLALVAAGRCFASPAVERFSRKWHHAVLGNFTHFPAPSLLSVSKKGTEQARGRRNCNCRDTAAQRTLDRIHASVYGTLSRGLSGAGHSGP